MRASNSTKGGKETSTHKELKRGVYTQREENGARSKHRGMLKEVEIDGEEDDEVTFLMSRPVRLLVVLMGAIVVAASPGSQIQVESFCEGDTFLDGSTFCNMSAAQRVAACSASGAAIFLADILLDTIVLILSLCRLILVLCVLILRWIMELNFAKVCYAVKIILLSILSFVNTLFFKSIIRLFTWLSIKVGLATLWQKKESTDHSKDETPLSTNNTKNTTKSSNRPPPSRMNRRSLASQQQNKKRGIKSVSQQVKKTESSLSINVPPAIPEESSMTQIPTSPPEVESPRSHPENDLPPRHAPEIAESNSSNDHEYTGVEETKHGEHFVTHQFSSSSLKEKHTADKISPFGPPPSRQDEEKIIIMGTGMMATPPKADDLLKPLSADSVAMNPQEETNANRNTTRTTSRRRRKSQHQQRWFGKRGKLRRWLGDLEDSIFKPSALRSTTNKRKPEILPLLTLLIASIAVVAMTTAVEVRELYLEHLSATNSVDRYLSSSLVMLAGETVHELQRERGLTGKFVSSAGTFIQAEKLSGQYAATDTKICSFFTSLLRHADADDIMSSAYHDTEPHEMAELVAPIFGIPAQRARLHPETTSSGIPLNLSSACKFHAVGVGTYICKSPRCRSLASILVFLQGQAPKVVPSMIEYDEHKDPNADIFEHRISAQTANFEFYSALNQNLLALATRACVELIRNLRTDQASPIAIVLNAYTNLIAFKEKCAEERGFMVTELAFVQHNFPINSSTINSSVSIAYAWPPLSALLHLREVVAQQSIFLSSFRAFAPYDIASAIDIVEAETCVQKAVSMRDALLDHLSFELNRQESNFSNNMARLRHPIYHSQQKIKANSSLQEHHAYVRFSADSWWTQQTCRIDGLHAVTERVAASIVYEATTTRSALRQRAIRLVAPLLVCLLFTGILATRSISLFLRYRATTEKRALRIERRRNRYRDLLARWAPIRFWKYVDEEEETASVRSDSDETGDTGRTDDSESINSSNFDANPGLEAAEQPRTFMVDLGGLVPPQL